MVQKIQTLLIDDLDGGAADETVPFGLDGTLYEIDLESQSAKELRATLNPYIEHARLTARGRVLPAPKRPVAGAPAASFLPEAGSAYVPKEDKREASKAEREWLRGRGHRVGTKGRIPEALHAEYRNRAR